MQNNYHVYYLKSAADYKKKNRNGIIWSWKNTKISSSKSPLITNPSRSAHGEGGFLIRSNNQEEEKSMSGFNMKQ